MICADPFVYPERFLIDLAREAATAIRPRRMAMQSAVAGLAGREGDETGAGIIA
jgi:hypothetical protein